MSKPETIQDLRAAGLVSERDVDRIAFLIFSNTHVMTAVVDGYVVTLPEFEELPSSCVQFIRKALGFSKVEDVLSYDTRTAQVEDEPGIENPGSHYALVDDPDEPL